MSEERTPALDKWFRAILFFLLVFVVGVRPFVPDSQTAFALHFVVNLLIISAVVVCVLRQLLANRVCMLRTGLELPGGIFLLAILVSVNVAVYKHPALLAGYSWICYFLLFFLIANSVRGMERRLLIWVLAASLFVVSLHGIHQRLFEIPAMRERLEADPDQVRKEMGLPNVPMSEVRGRLEGSKVFSTFTLSNSLAGFLAMMFPMQLALLLGAARRGERRVGRLALCGFATAAVLVCTYLTRSKGGWLAFAVGIALFGVLIFGRFLRRHKGAVAVLGVGILLILVVAQVLNLVPPLRDYPSSFKVRYGYWRAGVNMIVQKPLVGVGLGSWPDRYSIHKLPEDQETRKAHNDYIQLWVEMGLLGLGAYLWFWIVFFLRTRAARRGVALEPESPEEMWKGPLILAVAAGAPMFFSLFVFETPLRDSMKIYSWFWLALWLGWTAVVLQTPKISGSKRGNRMLSIGVSAGLAAFLLHEMIDFDLYVEGIAQTALVLAGLLVAGQLELHERERYLFDLRPGTLGAGIMMPVCIVALVLVSFRFTVPVIQAEKLTDRGRSQAEPLTDAQRVRLLEAAYELDPHNAEIALGISQLYLRLWNKRVFRLTPNGPTTLALALDTAKSAEELNPIRWSYQLQLGRLYEMRWRLKQTPGVLEACIRHYKAAYELFPSNPILAAYVGKQYERKGARAAAKRMYERALELDSFQYHAERRRLTDAQREWVETRIAALEGAPESGDSANE